MDRGSLSITVDIEDWYHIPSVCGSPFSVYRDVDEFFEKWPERYDYLSKPAEKVLQLLNEYDITATFFVVADVAQHYPGLIERIVDQGHEIACHGMHHRCKIDPNTKLPTVDYRSFEAMTIRSKRILESACKKRVIGYRAPNALVGGWMIDSLEGIGFKYDSSVSINSLYNKSDSTLAGVSTHPYFPKWNGLESGERRGFVEFPWPYLDMGLKVPTAGGPMLRFLSPEIIVRGINQSLKRGHTVLYFHPIDISDEKFPPIGNGRPMYWSVKGAAVERKLRHVLDRLKNIKKTTLSEALETMYEGQTVRASRCRQLATVCE